MTGIALLGGVLVYALFVGARAVVAAIARIPGRLPPFGEAPLGPSSRGSIVTRLALTLAGPLAVYMAVVVAWAVTARRMGVMDGPAPAVQVVPSGPAGTAGLRDGDRIEAVDGRPLVQFSDLKDAVAARPAESLELSLERGGERLRLRVTPGPAGSSFAGKLGVRQVATTPAWSDALHRALSMPLQALATQVEEAMQPRLTELSGPIGITRELPASAGPSVALMLAAGVARAGTTALAGFVMVALFLFPSRRRPGEAPSAAAEATLPAAPARRPWVRFAARVVDEALLVVVVCLIFAAINPALVEVALASSLLLAIPVEAALLASWGYTPGKWLLRVAVRDGVGAKLRFGQALRRAAAVNLFGLALNQPIGLVTQPLSFLRLRRAGSTYWDALDGSRVEHGAVGGGRATIAIVAVVALLAFELVIAIRSTAFDLLH
jgi:uncharacterized RDD family membrane protein YckC